MRSLLNCQGTRALSGTHKEFETVDRMLASHAHLQRRRFLRHLDEDDRASFLISLRSIGGIDTLSNAPATTASYEFVSQRKCAGNINASLLREERSDLNEQNR